MSGKKSNMYNKKDGAHTAILTTNFQTVAQTWFKSVEPQLKESSSIKYQNIIRTYLLPCFGNLSIESIEREDIINFSNELLIYGGQHGNGLSPKTVSSILSVLKSIFEYASGYRNFHVADIRKLSVKQTQKPLRILSWPEQKRLNRYLCENLTLSNLGILVCLYTGIRIGEICALKWEDISFEEQYLHVRKTMQRIQNQSLTSPRTSVIISAPKSECSIRKIPLPDNIFELLSLTKQPGNTYFLTGQTHSFVEPRTLQYRFKAVTRICNIENAHFHSLRHTFATRCIELGFDIKSLSEILGHASVNITLNRYVHPSMELKQKNMNMLSELLDDMGARR